MSSWTSSVKEARGRLECHGSDHHIVPRPDIPLLRTLSDLTGVVHLALYDWESTLLYQLDLSGHKDRCVDGS